MNIYGYARVSSKDQNATAQIDALKNFGVASEKIFVDRQSGKDFNRPQYRKLLRRLKTDSVLIVKSIDRLGRNYAEILDQWRIITKDKGAAVVVIDMPLLIAAAKARGVKFGRKALPRPENFGAVRDDWLAGKISARKAGKLCGVAHQTFLKWARAEN